jgi:hypothetical protein
VLNPYIFSGAEYPPKFANVCTSCYHFKESPMAWEAAKAYCTNLGAEMVVVESNEEQRKSPI